MKVTDQGRGKKKKRKVPCSSTHMVWVKQEATLVKSDEQH